MGAHVAPSGSPRPAVPFPAAAATWPDTCAPTRNRRHPWAPPVVGVLPPRARQAVAFSAAVVGLVAGTGFATPFAACVVLRFGVVSCPSVFQNRGPLTAG